MPASAPSAQRSLDLSSVSLPDWAQSALASAGRILLLILIGLIVRHFAHRVIDRVAERIATGRAGLGPFDVHLPNATALLTTSPLASARREQRARTMATVLKSLSTAVVGTVVILMITSMFYDIGPLLAGAGILGVAVGFGSQSLVKDVVTGIFMIVEDQYGVGDVVDVGEASGSVEAVGLRVTRVRDVDGTVWYVPNGQIQRVGNMSQGWARAVLDIAVDYDEDVARIQNLLLDIAQGVKADPQFAPLILDNPEVWGVEAFGTDSMVVRLVVKTQPLQQWTIARELRRRIKDRFGTEGVELPVPARAARSRPEPLPGPAGPHQPDAGPSDTPPPGPGPEHGSTPQS